MPDSIDTDRLILRRWRQADREPFAHMNADPRVMEFFPSVLSRAESDRLIDAVESHFERHGFGLFAVELRDRAAFAGFTGLMIPRSELPFSPCVEIGWRLSAEFWNRGLATEAARAVVSQAFGELGLEELVSFTAGVNQASRRVMEKIGMTRDPLEDFENSRLPEGHWLRPHVLYRLKRS